MNQFQLLATRRFAPLFAVQFLGAFNDNVFRFALIIFITFSLADTAGIDSRSLVVLSGGVFILPFFLFSSLAGQLADKYEKSSLIRIVKFTEIGVMLLGAIAFSLSHTGLLFVVLFLMGMQSTFFGPLKYGILPQHLTPAELTGGNGLIQTGTYAAILLGGSSGGVLASMTGLGALPVIICVVLLALCGWLCAWAIPDAPASDPKLAINWNLAQATYRLIRVTLGDRETATLVLTISWFWFLGATFLGLVPSYGKEFLGADERGVTLLTVAFTLGIGIGSILCERFSKQRIELGLMPFASLGISLFACDFYFAGVPTATYSTLGFFALLSHGPGLRAFIDLMVIGVCGAVFIVPLYAALQSRANPVRLARVMAALNVTNAAFMVGSALYTVALFYFEATIAQVFAITAALNMVAIVLAMMALPEFKQRAAALWCGASNH